MKQILKTVRFGVPLIMLLCCGCTEIAGSYAKFAERPSLKTEGDGTARSSVVRIAAVPPSTVVGASRLAAAEAILKLNNADGAKLVFRNDFALVFSDPAFNVKDRVSESSFARRDVETRLRYDLADEGPNTKVTLSVTAIEYPQTSRETYADLSNVPTVLDKSIRILKALVAEFPRTKAAS